jgi:hypothetical protein
MQSLLHGVAVLACPVGMGVMMWMTMRGQHHRAADGGVEEQITALRAEIDQLKTHRTEQPATGRS